MISKKLIIVANMQLDLLIEINVKTFLVSTNITFYYRYTKIYKNIQKIILNRQNRQYLKTPNYFVRPVLLTASLASFSHRLDP